MFSDILCLDGDKSKVYYELLTDQSKLIKTLDDKLDDYNMEMSNRMNLVFFEDCIEHILRVQRVLR